MPLGITSSSMLPIRYYQLRRNPICLLNKNPFELVPFTTTLEGSGLHNQTSVVSLQKDPDIFLPTSLQRACLVTNNLKPGFESMSFVSAKLKSDS